MAVFTLIGNALHKSDLEHNGKFGYALGRIQHIALMSRIVFFAQPDMVVGGEVGSGDVATIGLESTAVGGNMVI